MNNNLLKKITLALLALILIFGFIKAPKIKRYFAEQRYYSILVMLDLAERCYNPYKDKPEVFIQEGFDYEQYNNKIIADSLKKIADKSNPEKDLKIPSITHQIYFTPKNKTGIIKDFYIEKIKTNFNKLNATSANWKHNLWTNNPAIFPDELSQMQGVKVRDIAEFQDHPLYLTLINTLEKGNDLVAYLAESSDLFRLLALQKFGGIYNDMDYEIYNPAPLFEFMKKFDFIAGREHAHSYSYYGNSFIAAKPNHPVINEAVSRMIRNYRQAIDDKNTPDYIKYPCTANDKLYFNGPPLITLAYFAKNNSDGNNDVILPFWMILNQAFARFKNQSCDYAKITRNDFIQHDYNLSGLIQEFTSNFKMKDIEQYYSVKNSSGTKAEEQNIYYNTQYREGFEIIGADMGCGTWVTARNPRYFYWK